MTSALWAIAALLVVLCIYIALLALDAKVKTETAPRVPMFSCDKHGTMPAKYAVSFDGMGVLEEPQQVCPMCLEDRFKEARKNAGL